MITPSQIAFVVIATAWVAALWYVTCLHQASFVRSAIIDLICSRRKGAARDALLADYKQVTVRQHINALLIFRDALTLYSTGIRKLLHEEAGREIS